MLSSKNIGKLLGLRHRELAPSNPVVRKTNGTAQAYRSAPSQPVLDPPAMIIRVVVRLSQVTSVQLKGDHPQQPLKCGTCMIHDDTCTIHVPCPLQHVRQDVDQQVVCCKLMQVKAKLQSVNLRLGQ